MWITEEVISDLFDRGQAGIAIFFVCRVLLGAEEIDTIQIEQGGVYSAHIAKVSRELQC